MKKNWLEHNWYSRSSFFFFVIGRFLLEFGRWATYTADDDAICSCGNDNHRWFYEYNTIRGEQGTCSDPLKDTFPECISSATTALSYRISDYIINTLSLFSEVSVSGWGSTWGWVNALQTAGALYDPHGTRGDFNLLLPLSAEGSVTSTNGTPP